MRTSMRRVRPVSGLFAAAWLLVGCAAMQRSETRKTDSMLTQAGFQQRSADTADKAAHLAKLPPHKLMTAVNDGRRIYFYADPTGCNCVLIGDEAAFARYRSLVNAPAIEQ